MVVVVVAKKPAGLEEIRHDDIKSPRGTPLNINVSWLRFDSAKTDVYWLRYTYYKACFLEKCLYGQNGGSV